MSNTEQMRQALERIANYPLRDGALGEEMKSIAREALAAHSADRVPLTKEQIAKMSRKNYWHKSITTRICYREGVRDAEAAHNITAPSAGKEGE